MSFLTKKRVLITGGTGFIGANFVYKMLELGAEVHLMVRPESNFWRIKPIEKKIKLHFSDLFKEKEVESLMREVKPKIILHFATYGAYQSRQQDVQLTINTNLLGTVNLINSLKAMPFECFINTGSSSEYGIKNKPMKENDILEPDNLYGITKAGATMYCQLAARRFNLPIVTMRLFAVYGYFEDKDRLIPTVIKSCLTNSELNLASPHFVRDFIFIEDILEAYLLAIKNIHKIKGEIFNLGTGKQHKIREVVKIIKNLTNSPIKPTYGKRPAFQTEPKVWVADISKIKKILNWQPKYTLKQGLKKNIQWFQKNLSFYL